MTAQDSSSRFPPSARLGPYEIVGLVGKGGMGEVYRAKDTRLDREVAIKVLPTALGKDAQLRARFEREAKSVSALNHPHICTLYDVGQDTINGETLHYLVLEMIEGQSLATRISRGPLNLDEVLRYGKQIASALDVAHKRGIIHRDLKPGNVMITKAGAKLLDFGLAKAGSGGAVQSVTAIEAYDTLDKPLTEQGMIMGTFQYMSPEQLEGAPADARSDIFAFGAVLYEMATGRKAFEGKNRTSLIAAIVSSHPPPISAVQAMSPPALEHVVRKCLEKDPDDRWQSARDVAAELQWVEEGGSQAGLPAAVSSKRKHRESAAWATAAVMSLVALALAFTIAKMRKPPVPPQVVRFAMPNPEGLTALGPPAVSPDGRFVAFVAERAGTPQIWLRPIDTLEARPLPGTEGAVRVIWSPDSRYVAFRGGGKLRKVPVTGGPVQTIGDAPRAFDGTWNADGVILLDGQSGDPIWAMDAAGGVPRVEVNLDSANDITSVGWPEFLPDGRHFLYMSGPLGTNFRSLTVGELGSKEKKVLFKTGSRVSYAAPGYLVYVSEGTLVAQPFDPVKSEITGEPKPVGEGLGVNDTGGASFSVSQTGVLVFRSGEGRGRRWVWMDRNGKETPALEEPKDYRNAWVSPDGNRVVFDMPEGANEGDLWIRDLAKGVTSRFTFDAGADVGPVWSPDGRTIVYTRMGKNVNLFTKDASGTGEPVELLKTTDTKFPNDWSKDGSWLVYMNVEEGTNWDIWALPMKGSDRKPIPVARTKFPEVNASLSADGKLLAYASSESGRQEVYVQEFPEAKNKWLVSASGGNDPFWRDDGRELYYRSRDLNLMAVPIKTQPTFTWGTPQSLFKAPFAVLQARAAYRPSPDGKRFLVLRTLAEIPHVTVVLNWPAAIH